MLTATAQERLLEAAAAVRASGTLGRSRLLLSLFDYLVSRSADGRPPKESEIAYEVFGKTGSFETGQDAVVRVYIHRLRRKLEDYRTEADQAAGFHLTLPKGEYRIVGEPAISDGPIEADDAPAPRRRTRPDWRWIAAGIAAVILLNLGAWLLFSRPHDAMAETRRNPIWAPFVASDRPMLLVMGDYYIFGESDDGMDVTRLVREYAVNSPTELSEFLMDHPEKAARYLDLGLSYLPTSSASALAGVAQLFGGTKSIRVITTSQLTPELLKAYDVIYIGYISGMGLLEEPSLSGSRFAIGDSFDEIRDTTDGRRFVSQGGYGPARRGVYRDYGYVAVFPGPNGNHVAVISGIRDIGVMAAAEQMGQPAGLAALRKVIGSSDDFEALYEVTGQGEVNFRAKLLTAARRNPARDWSGTN